MYKILVDSSIMHPLKLIQHQLDFCLLSNINISKPLQIEFHAPSLGMFSPYPLGDIAPIFPIDNRCYIILHKKSPWYDLRDLIDIFDFEVAYVKRLLCLSNILGSMFYDKIVLDTSRHAGTPCTLRETILEGI